MVSDGKADAITVAKYPVMGEMHSNVVLLAFLRNGIIRTKFRSAGKKPNTSAKENRMKKWPSVAGMPCQSRLFSLS
jgi:hypothetical protein